MADLIYRNGKMAQHGKSANGGPIDWDADTLKIMLVNGTYRAIADATKQGHDFINDVSGNEVSGTGYTAGGQILTGASIALSGDSSRIDFTDPAWASSTITAEGAVVYKDTGNAATSPTLIFLDFGGAITSTNGTFTVQVHANGLHEYT